MNFSNIDTGLIMFYTIVMIAVAISYFSMRPRRRKK